MLNKFTHYAGLISAILLGLLSCSTFWFITYACIIAWVTGVVPFDLHSCVMFAVLTLMMLGMTTACYLGFDEMREDVRKLKCRNTTR